MSRLLKPGFLLASVLACSTLGVDRANAGPVAGYEYSTEANNAGGQLTVGEKFHTNAPIYIGALGIGDFSGGAITYSHPVGLWDAAGHLLASTTVNVGQRPIGHFQYQALAKQVFLPAGADFVIGAQIANPTNPGGPADPFAQQLFDSTIDPGVTLVDTRVHDDFLLAFPERVTQSGAVPAYPAYGSHAYEYGTFSANFLATPEPASLTIMVTGVVGLTGAAWCRRRRLAVKGPS